MVDGTLYLSTPFGRVIALDPERGTARWTYDAHIDRNGSWGDFANRGVSHVARPARAEHRGLSPANLPRHNRRPHHRPRCENWNSLSRLRQRGYRRPPAWSAQCAVRDSGVSAHFSAGRHQRPDRHRVVGRRQWPHKRGERRSARVRCPHRRAALDVGSRSRRDSTDPAVAYSWRGAMAHTTGAANAWSVIAADSARDIVFVPTGRVASPDYYGGERRRRQSLCEFHRRLARVHAAKSSGIFRSVHHDLWDYYNASPPALVDRRSRRPATIRRRLAGERRHGQPLRAQSQHRQPDLPRRRVARSRESNDSRTSARRRRSRSTRVASAAQPSTVFASTASGALTPADRDERVSRRFVPLRNEGRIHTAELSRTRCRISAPGGWEGGPAFATPKT